jgi:hypothetical protein
MRLCPLTDELCGMILARPVRSPAGGVLLAKGSALDARVIAILKSLGVTHVTVEKVGGAALSPAEAAAQRAIADREEKRFGDLAGDPYMTALRDAAIEVKASDSESWTGGAAGAGAAPSRDGADDA